MNGSVRGMGLQGILITGEGSFVERVNVDNNAGGGMVVDGSVVESMISANGEFGILAITIRECTVVDNQGDGIRLDGSGGVAIGNIASFNSGNGMVVPNGTVTGNTLVRNSLFGVSTTCPSTIIGNTIVSNTLGSIKQTNLEVCVLVNNATRP
jgi:parallel beta-helix repeat protein